MYEEDGRWAKLRLLINGRNRRGVLGLLLTIGFVLAMTSSASALTIGLNWDGPGTSIEQSVELTQDSGATVFHRPLNYVAPGGDWSEDDGVVGEAWRRGITILPTVNTTTGRFLYVSEPAIVSYGVWARELVERYGVNGTFWNGKAHPTPIMAWEVFNEPNMVENNPIKSETACKNSGEHYYKKFQTCVQPDAYGEFLKYTAEKIQAGSIAKTSHGTQVLFGGLYARSEAEEAVVEAEGGNRGSEAITTFIEKASLFGGLSANVTGIALHPYSLVGGATEMANKITRIHNFLGAIGAGGFSLWLTEIGWPVGGAENFPTEGHPVGLPEQSAYLTEAFNWIKANASADNIQFAAWFNDRDYGGTSWVGYCGLIDQNWNFRPAWSAFVAETGGPPALGASPAMVHEGANWWGFYRGSDGALHQESLVGGEWIDYKIGGQVAPGTTPSVVHEGSGWWVFYHGVDGTLHQESLVKGEWIDYKIGASMAWSTNPSVVHEGSGWWIFYQAADGTLHQESLVGGEWLDHAIGAQMAPRTNPVVIHEGGGWWVFYQGADGALHQESMTSGIWSDYRIGGSIAWSASPVVLHEASGWGFWAFYQGDDRALWEQSLSGGIWSGYRIGGEF